MRLLTVLMAIALLAAACTGTPATEAGPEQNDASEIAGPSAGRAVISPDGGEPAPLSTDDDSDADVVVTEAAVADDEDSEAAEVGVTGDAASENSSEAESSAAPIDESATTTAETAPEPEATVEEVIDELVAFVEAERGISFSSPPDVQVLDSGAFRQAWIQLIESDLANNESSYDEQTQLYQALGILAPTDTLRDVRLRFVDAGVIAFYDVGTENIVLQSGPITAFTQLVLVHELVHALEDQAFGLDRDSEHRGRDDEVAWTFSAIIEGSARTIEDRYRDTLSTAELDEAAAASAAISSPLSVSDLSTSFLELEFGRYRHGQAFTEAIWNAGGQSLLDAVLVTPPPLSEAVLEPDLIAGGVDAAPALSEPPADGAVVRSGVFGAAGFASLLADTLGVDEAVTVAEGWAADRYVVWADGDAVCVRIHLEAEDPTSLDEFADALSEWALDGDREIFYPTADLIRVTSCS